MTDTTFLWEDNLLERKVESDLKDLLKTIVGFANSVRPDHTAVILIGERDDGTVDGVLNPDNIQKEIRKQAERVYPPIVWRCAVYQKTGKSCIRMEIDYSGDTPHFGGPAWIRKGSETIVASDEMFQKLIEVRLSHLQELNKWVGKKITVVGERLSVPNNPTGLPTDIYLHFSNPWPYDDDAFLVSANPFWVTIKLHSGKDKSQSISRLSLSFDDDKQQLKLIISYY